MKSTVVLNWKMNPASFAEAKKLFVATKKAADSAKSVSVIVAPPALYLRDLYGTFKGRRVALGVQNVHSEPSGAHTGEFSVSQVRDSKATHALVGHAERRALGETSEDTRLKVKALLDAKMIPVLCVGESSRSESGEHFRVVAEQLRLGLADAQKQVQKVVIAYEPVWAIGATQPMSARDMHEMAIFIRKTIMTNGHNGMAMKILYGGAIDEVNAVDMMRNGDVSGLLVGRASLDPKKITALIAALNAA